MARRRPPNPLRLERLEDRATPALFGTPWPDSGHLTLSFVPDGADVSGVGSNLGATFGNLPTAVWQGEFVRAFQTWGQYANLNVAVVPDDGAPLGAPGPVQGSTGHGDIRVSARPLSDNVLAVTNPFDLHSTWAGDIVVNSNKLFTKDAAAGRYDLFTVAVQEAGHSLGLDNSPELASVMYTTYTTPKTKLTAGDVGHIQSLYGSRDPDRFDLKAANDKLDKATNLTFVANSGQLAGDPTAGDAPLVAVADLSTANDKDNYAFRNPKNSNSFSVALQTAGVSQLQAKISLVGPDGKSAQFRTPTGELTSSADAVSVGGEPFVVTVDGARADSTYTVVIGSSKNDASGVGGYRLAVGNDVRQAVTPPTRVGLVNPDFGTNDRLDRAYNLGDVRAKTDARWNFVGTASIESASDVDYYKLHTKKDTQSTAVILVSALDSTGLAPAIAVYNKDGVLQPTELLSSSDGTLSVQLKNIRTDTDYIIKVSSANGVGGNYLVATDFRATPVALSPLAAGTLGGSVTEALTTFNLVRSQAIYFELTGQAGVAAAVRLTVYDANNSAVATVAVRGGDTGGTSALLAPGLYTVRYSAAGADGAALPTYKFSSKFTLSSDPIGPTALDPTAPAGSPRTSQLFTYSPQEQTYVALSNEIDPLAAPASEDSSPVIIWQASPPRSYFYESAMTDVFTNPWW